MKRKAIAQKQIWHEYGYQNYLEEFKKVWDLTEVQVIPFTKTINPEPDFVPELVMGSGRLITIARNRGWSTFETFDPVEFDIFPKELWLNRDGWEAKLEEYNEDPRELFVKPYTEKLFTAGVTKENTSIFNSFQFTKTYDECKGERIWVNTCQKIEDEIRLFVVAGELITGSLYKRNGIAQYAQISPIDPDWVRLKDIIHSSNRKELTAVVDVTKVDGEYYIIEMNTLNSSGVYESDYAALARALYNLT